MDRTTIRLDEGLKKDVKRDALESGQTFTDYVADALREKLARRNTVPKRRRVTLPTSRRGGGVQPGVDLHNNAALLELMEEYDAASRR